MRVLLIEDERKIASFIKRGLKEEHYVVDTAFDGEEGAYLASINEYDLIVLDIMLPKKNGIEVCAEIRSKNISIPVLMLTAKDTTRDKVIGLDSGADDYLTKPFAFDEFLARVRSLTRRLRVDKNVSLKAGDLELDQISHQVKRAGVIIPLTSKEYALLEYLMLHKGQVVTRTMISEHVWNEDFDSFTNVIDVYIKYLRNKIDKSFSKQLIYTIRGSGYIIKD